MFSLISYITGLPVTCSRTHQINLAVVLASDIFTTIAALSAKICPQHLTDF